MYCLALYGCCVWRLNSPNFSVIEIAFNKILRKIWNLPSRSHSSIAHCVANIPAIRNIVHKCFFGFTFTLNFTYSFQDYIRFLLLCLQFNWLNFLYGDSHLCPDFSEETLIYSSRIRLIRNIFGTVSPFEDLILSFSCS